MKKFIFTLVLILSLFCLFCLESFTLQKNVRISSNNKSTSQYIKFFKEAEDYRLSGNFEKSIELFEKSLLISQKLPDKERESNSYLKIALLYWNMGQLKKSGEIYQSALALSEKFDLRRQYDEAKNSLKIYSLYTKGKEYRYSGEHQKSLDSFQKAIKIARNIGSKEHELKCLRLKSITHLELNELKEFSLLNEAALQIAKTLNHRKEEGRCSLNIGLFYQKLDNYSKALNFYESALKAAQDLQNKKEESSCLNNIGLIYRTIGDYDKSLDYLNKALELDIELRNDLYISMDLNNIGATYKLKGHLSGGKEDFDKAHIHYQKSLKLARKIDHRKLEIKLLNNIGSLYAYQENHQEALKNFQSAYDMAEEIQDIKAMSFIQNNIGIVYYNQGNYEESAQFNQNAIDLALEVEGEQFLWEPYLEIGKAYAKQNKFNDAFRSYKNSIRIIENIRSQIKLEELKASYLGTDKRIDAYHNLIHLLTALHKENPKLGYDIEAFDYLERAKARAFLDSLEISQVNIHQGIDSELINQEKELMKDISILYNKLLAIEPPPEEKNVIIEQLKKKEHAHETLKREIRTKSPAYADLRYPKIISLEDVQKKLLDKNTAFFAYLIGNENSYAFVVTKKRLKIFPLPPKDKIQKLISDYLKVISDKENQNFQSGFTLFNQLVLPGLTKNIKNIIFIPDDILHFLPFESLITQETANNWLIKDFKITYAPSISSLWEIIERKNSNGSRRQMDILAFGDPSYGYFETENNGNDIFQNYFSSTAFNFYRLKHSGTEIEKICSLFNETKKNAFLRENATEEQLKNRNLEDYKIIHFATHSIIDEKKPHRSSIVLSLDNNPREDGFLQMREILNLKLNADLVTLSACQTGLGQFIKGEGIEGLNRAFFYAGSSAVLMSLWPINDQATYQLMERFYFHLRSSESIASALRKAKLEMVDSDAVVHPYYWAGFIISGKADQLIFPKSTNKWLFLGVSFLFIGGIVFASTRRLKNGRF